MTKVATAAARFAAALEKLEKAVQARSTALETGQPVPLPTDFTARLSAVEEAVENAIAAIDPFLAPTAVPPTADLTPTLGTEDA